ncbi:MAG: DegV family EDD domain-containing protein, partial [Clostridia bacterium]|nr:DegV family EDD domain-containing protein [Clostridia bacterium]
EKYPERKIICVDTLRYSTAISVLIVQANEKRASGATIEETAEYLNQIKYNVHQSGFLDDLYFCVKTGRISNFKAFFGTMVGVHSMGEFSRQGLPAAIGKVKGKQSAIRASVDYLKETIRNPEEQIIFVANSNRKEYAEQYAELIRKEIKPKEVIVNSVGMACGASIGPGLVAAYYLGTETSENLSTETQIMNQVIKNMK